VRDAGLNPVLERQPPLPAPTQPAILASEEDHALARHLLVEQRRNDPDYRDPSKQIKRIFRSSKEKEKLQDTNQWEFSQEELDRALSAVIEKPTTSSGLVQAFLNLGAKVNFVDIADKKSKGAKKSVVADRRRSTVLQRAATVRRADSLSLLAAAGADQFTLDEGLKAALAANNHPCVQELLRHGADVNKCPNALADAVRSNDQNFIRLLLRAPKALRPDIVSSCLPAAVGQKSEPIISLLVGHGADPNFDGASALKTAISQREYRLAVALVAGPCPLSPLSLQAASEIVLQMSVPQDRYQFLQLLFCCGLSPNTPGLGELLLAASQRSDTPIAELLINYGVPTSFNEAECLRNAILRSNWKLVDLILTTPISSAHASIALAVVPMDIVNPNRLRVISALVSKGATGRPLERWLVRAVEDGDSSLMDLLLTAGAPLDSGNNQALQAAVARKDIRSLRTLLSSRPSPRSLARVFPLIRSGYTPPERLQTVRVLLEHGARGPEIDQALIEAVADTSTSRDIALITELVRHGASIDHENGQVLKLAVSQVDLPVLRLLCGSKPAQKAKSAALPLIFDAKGCKQSASLAILELLLANGVEEGPAIQTLELAMKGGPDNIDIIDRLITADARLLGPAFQYATAINSTSRKEPILKFLLSKGLSQETLDKALVIETQQACLKQDLSILQLLLDQGASVKHDNGKAFTLAVAAGNSSLVKALLNGKDSPAPATITTAFGSLFNDFDDRQQIWHRHSNSVVEIADELLRRGVDGNAINCALRNVLDPRYGDNQIGPTMDLLLKYNADVNTANGACFVSAARRGDQTMFTKLLAHQPVYSTVVPSLIDSEIDEKSLFKLLESMFSHGCTSDDLDRSHPPSLILIIQKYPRGSDLVKLLLEHGCNPDASIPGIVDTTAGEESLTALLWALAQPQKLVSTAVITALIQSRASPTRVTPVSEIAPIALAAREGRADIVQILLEHGADASIRDKWNRSALFYSSSSSAPSIAETLAPQALKNDGSLHEAARSLQVQTATLLVKFGHDPNFPSRLHAGRNALGELCLNAELTNGSQRTKARQLIRLFLDNGANPKFKARNERAAVLLALDNPFNPFAVTEALLETEVWEGLNDDKHMFHDAKGLWYSPLKYVELIPSPSRAHHKQDLLDLLRDKGCEPKFYSSSETQPPGAVGMPEPIARLADRQKEHQLTLKLAAEASEHARMLEETTHRDVLRRQKEQQDAELAAAAAAAAHHQSLDQRKHEFDMQRVREAERMKRNEKSAWHALLAKQEADAAAQRQLIEDRRASAAFAHESRLLEARKAEAEHRAGVERRALKEKEEFTDREAKMRLKIQDRADESAKLHASLRQDRKAIEWGSVD